MAVHLPIEGVLHFHRDQAEGQLNGYHEQLLLGLEAGFDCWLDLLRIGVD